MIQITGKIENYQYTNLLQYLYSKCDVLTFSLPDVANEYITEKNIDLFPWCNLKYHVNSKDSAAFLDYKENIEYLVREFRRFYIYEYIDVEYAGHLYGNKMEIKVVKFDEDVLNVLYAAPGLYNWAYPQRPEDLCFYSGGKCFLRTVTHEKLCFIYADDDKTISDLKKIGLKIVITSNESTPTLPPLCKKNTDTRDVSFENDYQFDIQKLKNVESYSGDIVYNHKVAIQYANFILENTLRKDIRCFEPVMVKFDPIKGTWIVSYAVNGETLECNINVAISKYTGEVLKIWYGAEIE